MHLTLHADYALRTLLYLALHPGRVVPTAEVSRAYGISKHHLVRVAQGLGARLTARNADKGLLQEKAGHVLGLLDRRTD